MTGSFTAALAALGESKADLAFLSRSGVQVIPYRELLGMIASRAMEVRAAGVTTGERVIVELQTDLDHIVTFLSLIYAGAVPVSVKPAGSARRADGYLHAIARRERARFFYGADHVDGCSPLTVAAGSTLALAAPFEPTADDIAFVQYTSGSTGDPRPVSVSHAALVANLETITRFDGRSSTSVGFNCLPLHHDMGLVGGLLSCLFVPHTLLLTDVGSFLRRPLVCLDAARDMGATVTAMPNFLLEYITRSLERRRITPRTDLFSAWSTIYCGAELIRSEAIAAFLRAAVPLGLDPRALALCYGLAEATLIVTGHRFVSERESFDRSVTRSPVARLGPPLGSAQIRIDVEAGSQDGVGRLQIRGPSLFRGYDGARDFSREWFDTGDIGYLRDGELFVCGRDSEFIVVNGENVFVADIERHLLNLEGEGVEECVVLPHHTGLYAYVVIQRGVAPDAAALSAAVARAFGVGLRAVHFGSRGGITRTTSGKPVREDTLRTVKAVTGS